MNMIMNLTQKSLPGMYEAGLSQTHYTEDNDNQTTHYFNAGESYTELYRSSGTSVVSHVTSFPFSESGKSGGVMDSDEDLNEYVSSQSHHGGTLSAITGE